MPELSAAALAEGRRLDKAATEGPWDIDTHEHLEKGCRCGSCYDSPTVIQTTNMLGCQDVSPFSCEQSGYSGSDAELIVWARNHLPALLDAAEKLNRVHAALANHPRVCDVHPDDDVIGCGWMRAVAGVQWAINSEEKSASPAPVMCGGCRWCENEQMRGAHALDPEAALSGWGMVVCPDCGNKRCPKATHHDHACTGSNAPGQPGSVYGGFDLDTSWLDLDDDTDIQPAITPEENR